MWFGRLDHIGRMPYSLFQSGSSEQAVGSSVSSFPSSRFRSFNRKSIAKRKASEQTEQRACSPILDHTFNGLMRGDFLLHQLCYGYRVVVRAGQLPIAAQVLPEIQHRGQSSHRPAGLRYCPHIRQRWRKSRCVLIYRYGGYMQEYL